ncbi:MAG: DUF624 domain-containing protein [Chloroflexi bacterium]|nr:DUF624 domain-containing protein [Chloroflexota bacterium]
MRAFVVAWRAIVSFYNELFFLIGMSLLWWLTGGIFVAAALVLGWPLAMVGGPWWLAPLLAIPAGPATAALTHVARRVAREERVDRSFFWEGFRLYWRKALALNAISMVILALLCLNLLFYARLTSSFLQALSFLWLYLIVFWLSAQLYLFPMLIALKEPRIWAALRTTAVIAFANPIFSILLLILALALTALCVVLAILVPLAWPALMVLLGEHALKLLLERAGIKGEEQKSS